MIDNEKPGFSRGERASARRTVLGRCALQLLVTLCVLLVGAGYSFSGEGCEYPDHFGTMLVSPEQRVGEFRITLALPDFRDKVSVQRHLVFSETLARLLGLGLKDQTKGLCSSVITTSPFPDLRAFLFLNDNPRDGDQKVTCVNALKKFAAEFQPTRHSIDTAIAAVKSVQTNRSVPGTGNVATAAALYIFRIALSEIYDADTVMHALLSVDVELFRAIYAYDFLQWLHRQRSGGTDNMVLLRTDCASQMGRDVSDSQTRYPSSSIVPAGVLEVSMPHAWAGNGDIPSRAVIVGRPDGRPNRPIITPATDRFCNRRHDFDVNENSGPIRLTGVLISCLSLNFYGIDSWTLFFCEPDGRISKTAEEQIMTMIARDPDVLALSRASERTKQTGGPYLVHVRGAGN